MKYFGEGLSEKHKELSKIIRKKDEIERARKLFLDIRVRLHLGEMSGGEKTEVDGLVEDLQDREYAIIPTRKDESIAWGFWHITRLEDLTMNLLVDEGGQVLCKEWQDRLGVQVTDTGNAMSFNEIMNLSRTVNVQALLCYRNAVGKRTREIVKRLSAEDMKRKVSPKGLDRILQ